nr:diphthine--ammonia ligase [Candidatus Undinarchaeales archaeon ERR594346 U_76725]
MKLAALFSGGKDSTASLYKAMQDGHEITHLVTALASNPDSYLFHTSAINMAELASEAMGIPLVKVPIESTFDTGEAEELEEALSKLDIDGITLGGVSSNYQGNIFTGIASKLGLEVVAPFWEKPHEELIDYALDEGFKIIFVSVSADGLDQSWLGRELNRETYEELKKIREKYRSAIGGEGGEYCTLVIDGPIFKKRIKIENSEVSWKGMAGKLIIKKANLSEKVTQ